MRHRPATAWLSLVAGASLLLLAAQAQADGELRLSSEHSAGQATQRAEAEWRHVLHLGRGGVSLGWNFLAAHARPEGGAGRDASRVNELQASVEGEGWAASAGRKIVAWDVGYGWRPNDVVQQELRRTLSGTTQPGRPLLQLEHFGSDSAAALVWVNPHHHDDETKAQRGAEESALAARLYQRRGALDLHGFARLGRESGASAGAALAWVATDALELHASVRALQRYRGWTDSGNTGQALLGLNWTGEQQQSLIVEAWHDGTAPSNAQWRAWGNRPRAAVGPNLRRDNLFARLAWQPEKWLLSLDALFTPADGGRVVTAGAQWQGDRWRLNLALRQQGGAADSVFALLPGRRQGLAMLSWSF